MDIEGTTTPVDFVYQGLFPFARDHLGGFLQDSWGTEETREVVDLLKTDYQEDLGQHQDLPNWQEDPLDRHRESGENYATWLMAQDRKSTGLKALQGKIWERGYQLGELRGEVYPDVLSAFERWAGGGKDICIFSSGSILAQQLLFSNTRYGDLKPFIKRYFDTTTGSKIPDPRWRQKAIGKSLPSSTRHHRPPPSFPMWWPNWMLQNSAECQPFYAFVPGGHFLKTWGIHTLKHSMKSLSLTEHNLGGI